MPHPRSSLATGWKWNITRAELPENGVYGYLYDSAGTFVDQSDYPIQPVAVRFTSESEPISILEGDYITIHYDGGAVVNVYPPPLSGDVDTYYYIGSDGSTYTDRWLYDLAKAATTPIPTATPTPSVTPTPSTTPTITVTPTVTPSITPTPTPSLKPTATPTATATIPPSPSPSPTSAHRVWGDYNGDGTSDVAIYRPAAGLWAVRGMTRVYFGTDGDFPQPDYNDGAIVLFRPSTGLWAVRDITRFYFGEPGDLPVPGDYDGDGSTDAGIYRPTSGLWAIRGVTRVYFGSGEEWDVPLPIDYLGTGSVVPAIFRPSTGLWSIRGVTRVYFGNEGDFPATR